MSSISDLKNGGDIVIDMTQTSAPEPQQPQQQKGPQQIDMSTGKAPAPKRRPSTGGTIDIANAKPVSTDEIAATLNGGKLEMDERDVAQNMVMDPQQMARNYFEGNDSMFANYLREKKEEYDERMEEFDATRERLIEEGKLKPEDIKDHLNPLSNMEDPAENTTEHNGRVVRGQDLDLDDLMADDTGNTVDDFEEDDEPVEEAPVVEEPQVQTAEPVESTLVKKEELVQEQPKTMKESLNETRAEEKPKKKKDTSVYADDLDIDIMSSAKFVSDEEAEEEEDSAAEESNDTDDDLNRLKELATEKLAPAFRKLDISNFQVVEKKASAAAVSSLTEENEVPVVKWVISAQKQAVFMRQFAGIELERLSSDIDTSSLTSTRHAYRMIYDHDMSAGKPKKFTEWLKVTPETALEDYFFAIFIASYQGTNYLPMTCSNDNCPDPTFMTEDIPIMKMVKFPNEQKKEEFMHIYQNEIVHNNTHANYVVARVPVTDKIAIDFKLSTLHDQLMKQTIGGDRRFIDKNSITFDVIQNIDNVYMINWQNNSLEPVRYKDEKNKEANEVTDYRMKISKYHKIFTTLNSDQFSVIRAIVSGIQRSDNEYEPMMSYVIPEVTCPNCGAVIEQQDTNAIQLVFTRYQLGALVNTTIR